MLKTTNDVVIMRQHEAMSNIYFDVYVAIYGGGGGN
jgi:hypothetical protein